MPEETWKPVPGYEGKYEVSDLGRVRSLDRRDAIGRPIRGRVLKAGVSSRGYEHVSLSDGRRALTRAVHTMVLEAFRGPRPPGAEACHGEGGARDNRLANLRWDSHSENMIDRSRHGTCHHRGKVACNRGHSLEPPNLVASQGRKGWRSCLACNRAFARKARDPMLDMQAASDAIYEEIMTGQSVPLRDGGN